MKKAVCAIAKDEAIYLAEWIAHYVLIGFDSIVIYDNASVDGTSEILHDLSEKGILTHIKWPSIDGVSPQLSAYNDCIDRFKDDFDFIAFVDVDEFIYTESLDISSYLKNAPNDTAAIAINQLTFGSSGHDTYLCDYVTRRFNRCSAQDYSERLWVKSIINPARVSAFLSPHKASISSGRYLHSDYTECEFDERYNGAIKRIVSDSIQVNHYILKSKQEFFEKKIKRGGAASASSKERAARHTKEFFDYRDQLINKDTFTYPDWYFSKIDEIISSMNIIKVHHG